jgi:hypothetical protein
VTAKFEFFQVVRITSKPKGFEHLQGKEGPVLGKAECDEGRWTYSVSLAELGENISLYAHEISSTGKFVKREDIYDGSSIRVSVDPETGEGKLVE